MNLEKRRSLRRSLAAFASFAAVSLALFAIAYPAPAQTGAEKKPLTHKDYNSFRTIQSPLVSPDGNFIAYAVVPPEGDTEVIVLGLNNKVLYKHMESKAGGKGGKAGAKGGGGKGKGGAGPEAGVPGTKTAFTPDSRYLLFTVPAAKGEAAKAGPDAPKAEAAEPARQSLAIMNLADGKVKMIPNVRNFTTPEDRGSDLLVYHLFPTAAQEVEKKADAPAKEKKGEDDFLQQKGQKGGKKGGAAAGGPAAAAKGAQVGDLVMQNISSDATKFTIADVADFTLTRNGRWLVCSVSAKDPGDCGLFAFGTPQGKLIKVPLVLGKAKYTRFTWDENQRFLAFFIERGDAKDAKDPYVLSLNMWDSDVPVENGPAIHELVGTKEMKGVQSDMTLTDRGQITVTEDGSKVFFAVAPPTPIVDKEAAKEPVGKGGAKDDKAVVELWHWKDDFIQPMQKVRAAQEKGRTFAAVWHVRDKRVVQLADKTMSNVTPSHTGTYAIGVEDAPYRPLVAYDGNYADLYIISTIDGSRKLVFKKHHGALTFSPTGRFAIAYDGKDWNSVGIPDGNVLNITKSVPTNFFNEDYDSPSEPPSYGIAGWSADEYFVLLYDKYDIWKVALRGGGFENLTKGIGRKEKVQFRNVKLDPKEKSIDLSKSMLLHAESFETRETGFAFLDANTNNGLTRNKMYPVAWSFPTKAKYGNTLLMTGQTFYDYPDLYAVPDMDFGKIAKVSNANPDKSKFVWGKSELIGYKSADGVPLTGILIKPENFDPKKKYPMIVYIYERLSQNLNHFVVPKEGTSINPSYYASNGYLVLMPDIVYNIGYPGQSALKCVLPAIQAVADKGYLDEDAIGIQGHSWGGYQIAYMVTQTNRFKAAAAGAAVSNMTSAYDGIRWGSGLPRQFQYEKTQSRIGGSLWDYPMRFIENSPIFMADRVKTPLMLLNNDQDDAVPWYQGIEYYLALRRLGKEVYMFNYPGEKHGLTKKSNQLDYTIRMQQFFDHYLRGAPTPEWMARGIPYMPPPGAKGPAIPDDDN
jgi:dienelactone hydrolase